MALHVPAGLEALGDDRVDAGVLRRARFVDRAGLEDDLRAGAVRLVDELRRIAPEEDHDGRADLEPLEDALADEVREVRQVDDPLEDEVHAEGLVRERADLRDLLRDALDRHVRPADHPEPARVRYRSGELGARARAEADVPDGIASFEDAADFGVEERGPRHGATG